MSLNLDFISSEFNLRVASDVGRIVYLFEGYRLDVQRRMLYRGDNEVALPPKAVETLIALVEQRGEIVGKDDLMKAIWAGTVVEESNIDHYLHLLRKRLGQKSDGQAFIETLRRRGYRFTSEVRVLEFENGNGERRAPADSNPVQYEGALNSSQASTDGSSAALPVTAVKPSRFSPLLLAIAVLSGLLASAATWYFQRQNRPDGGTQSSRGEISITPLTNGNTVFEATISPDGKYFAYHEIEGGTNHFWVQQIGQTSRIEIISPREWRIGGKTFSPKGEFIYFAALERVGGSASLYRVPTLGGTVTKLAENVTSSPSFSPDGSEIVFGKYNKESNESSLVIASADGGLERTLLTRPGAGTLSTGNAWSPDGELVAFESIDTDSMSSSGRCSLHAIEIKSGNIKDLSPERWDECFRMVWTRDGKGLVLLGTRSGEGYSTRRGSIYYLSIADARSRRISTDGGRYQDSSLGITADNSIIAVPHKMFSQIWVINAAGDARTAVQMTSGQMDGSSGVAPLPDGRVGYITRIGGDRKVWIMNADGSDQHEIADISPSIEELRATTDGRYFIFSGRFDGRSHLFRIDADGQNLTQLTTGESNEVDSTVSPDGRWVYYLSDVIVGNDIKTYLKKTEIDTGSTVDLKQITIASPMAPHISPDGKAITIYTADGLKIFSASDGSEIGSLKTEGGADFWIGAKWTPDGRSVTYLVHRGNSNNIWVQPVSGAPARQLTDFPQGYIYEYAYSHDGTKLYVARGYQTRDAVLVKNF
jgi:Tol biopolymer transport system component/DNA-binding winged helix-turn-helix (wHTH) protein